MHSLCHTVLRRAHPVEHHLLEAHSHGSHKHPTLSVKPGFASTVSKYLSLRWHTRDASIGPSDAGSFTVSSTLRSSSLYQLYRSSFNTPSSFRLFVGTFDCEEPMAANPARPQKANLQDNLQRFEELLPYSRCSSTVLRRHRQWSGASQRHDPRQIQM